MSGIVQISCLGKFGGWGNQLFQYCFARAYAEKNNAELQLPPYWHGRFIFKDAKDFPVQRGTLLTSLPLDHIPKNGSTNVNLFGYFQFREALDYLSKEKVKKWLEFSDEWVQMFPKIDNFYIACHVRRGDYATKYSHIYCTISEQSYLDAMKEYGYNESNSYWTFDEQPSYYTLCPYPYLPDFFTLMNSDVLFRANSTYSVWASILGNCETYSPVVEGITGLNRHVKFVPGNHTKILRSYNGASPKEPCEFIFGK